MASVALICECRLNVLGWSRMAMRHSSQRLGARGPCRSAPHEPLPAAAVAVTTHCRSKGRQTKSPPILKAITNSLWNLGDPGPCGGPELELETLKGHPKELGICYIQRTLLKRPLLPSHVGPHISTRYTFLRTSGTCCFCKKECI